MVLKIKLKPNLVVLNGCYGCSKTCKYNAEIADPIAASNYDNALFGCNSGPVGFKLEEYVKGEAYVG